MAPRLIAPTTDLYAAWLEAHREWGPGLHEDGFGLSVDDEVESTAGFSTWIERVAEGADRGVCRWIVEGGRVQGGIALRYVYNDRTGHVGYGIRPSARGRGLATWALGKIIDLARDRAMGRLLIVCEAANVASARTIERNGGVLAEVRSTPHGDVHRYWIDLV